MARIDMKFRRKTIAHNLCLSLREFLFRSETLRPTLAVAVVVKCLPVFAVTTQRNYGVNTHVLISFLPYNKIYGIFI
jgi:hypothetical protein